jgi:hypothetical protein
MLEQWLKDAVSPGLKTTAHVQQNLKQTEHAL